MKIKIILLVILAFSFSVESYAHKDRCIRLIGDKLEGLPTEYQPASFSYEYKTLTIGQNTMVIPESIWIKFGDTKQNPLDFSASWYHSRSTLPPYMSIENSKFGLLLNLDSLEIIEVLWNYKLSPQQIRSWNTAIKRIPNK